MNEELPPIIVPNLQVHPPEVLVGSFVGRKRVVVPVIEPTFGPAKAFLNRVIALT